MHNTKLHNLTTAIHIEQNNNAYLTYFIKFLSNYERRFTNYN